MSAIVFNPDEEVYQRSYNQTPPGLLGWFMKLTGTTDERSANAGLLVVAIIFFVLAGIIFLFYL